MSFGLALDIGTTTVQAQFVNLDTGESLETVSVLNAQRKFGDDVISRIAAAREGKTKELYAVINNQIQDITRQFFRGRNLREVEQCTVSGNTTMLHLFCGEDPSAMGEFPYTPVFLQERHFKGTELSLPARNITLLPGISAFVGADIVSGLAFIDAVNKKEDTLFIDLGTNGEMAVWKSREKRLLCCAAAAGPCFEKSGIIYGSDLIDAIAAMKSLGAMDETGALAGVYSQTGFPVKAGIVVTQKDVRLFQLAKSAIFSGVSVLCKTTNIKFENLGEVYIAGGLGNFLNLENAAAVGLLPKEFTGISNVKVKVCGNTSLKGAAKNLADPAFLPRCREIAAKGIAIDLALDREFAEMFAENMLF